MKNKILLALVASVVFLSATILPSFAWSIGGDPPTISRSTKFTRDKEIGETEDGGFYCMFEWTPGNFSFSASDLLVSGNTLTTTDFVFQIYNDNGHLGAMRVSPSNYRFYSYRATQQPFPSFGDSLVDIVVSFSPVPNTTENLRIMVEVYSSTWINSAETLKCRVYAYPSRDVVYTTLYEYADSIDDEVETLRDQNTTLSEENTSLRETVSGLQNNNVLGGLFEGVGDGFTSLVTPLLDISVGGITLADFLGVFLVIGIVLLFVLVINKIRGA